MYLSNDFNRKDQNYKQVVAFSSDNRKIIGFAHRLSTKFIILTVWIIRTKLGKECAHFI